MRLIWAFTPFIFAAVALSGCGGNGGSSPSSGGSPFVPSNTYTLNSNVADLDKTAAVVTSVTTDTVVLTGAPALTPGQILIHNALDETRFLRKVVSATVSGGTTTVVTSAAEATDVFKSANIAQQTFVSQEDLLRALQPAVDGLTIAPADKGSSRALDISTVPKISLTFANLSLKDGSGNTVVDVNGTVSIGAGVETIWKQSGLNPLPSEVGVSGLAYVSGTLKAHAHSAGTFSSEFPLTLKGPGIPIAGFGPLGVNMNIQLLMKVEGSYTADGDFVASATISAAAGVHYDNTNHWQFSKSFLKDFNLQPPSVRGQIDIGVSLIRPSISIDVLQMGEVGVKSDVMKVLAKISGQTSPVAGFQVEGYGDFAFTTFGSLHIGPWKLWSDSRDFDLGKFSIVKPFFLKTLAATDTQIAYLSPTRTALYAANGDGKRPRLLYTAPVAVFTPDISSATKKIAFISFDKTTYAPSLNTITADGKTIAKVNVGSLQPNDPSWSPNGSEIAFDANDSAGIRQINVVNLATGAVRKLSSEGKGGGATEPTWSPDGQKIYYQRFSNSVFAIAVTSSASATFDGVLANDTRSYTDPNISPNGTMLVAKRSDVGIVLSDPQGRNERTLVGLTSLSHPRFSPDGAKVIVQDDASSMLYLFDVSTGNRTTVGAGIAPSWGLR